MMRSFSKAPGPTAGTGLGILVNANAKRGGRRIAAELQRALPGADVVLTKRPEEIDGWLSRLEPKRALFAAGGDGTAIALLNALVRAQRTHEVVGALPLGTGNAWAHALGAKHLHLCVMALQRWHEPMPSRRYDFLTCEGIATMFAGSGWDAEVLADYQSYVAAGRGAMKRMRKTVFGYMQAMLTKTAPRSLFGTRPTVRIQALGEHAYVRTEHGEIRALHTEERDRMYEGPVSTLGASTCPEFGFRFRAFPHAERMPGLFNLRLYTRGTLPAVLSMHKLWRGDAWLPGIHDWFSDHVRLTFSRPFALQIAGESVGERSVVEYKSMPSPFRAIDWRGMRVR
jgi:diacylglycerol kinase family enzyme